MQILGTPCGLTAAVKNIGTTTIPAYRWCVSEIRTDTGGPTGGAPLGGTFTGQSTSFQHATALGFVHSVRAVPTSGAHGSAVTEASILPVGVTVASIKPGAFGLVVISGVAICETETALTYETEASQYLAIQVTSGNEGKVYASGTGAAESVVARLLATSYTVNLGADYLSASGVNSSASRVLSAIFIDPSFVVFEQLLNE